MDLASVAASRHVTGWVAISRSMSLIRAHSSHESRMMQHMRTQALRILRLMRQAERLGQILERLSGNGTLSVSELSRDLAVSAATIRRDLQLLEEQRLLSRT